MKTIFRVVESLPGREYKIQYGHVMDNGHWVGSPKWQSLDGTYPMMAVAIGMVPIWRVVFERSYEYPVVWSEDQTED